MQIQRHPRRHDRKDGHPSRRRRPQQQKNNKNQKAAATEERAAETTAEIETDEININTHNKTCEIIVDRRRRQYHRDGPNPIALRWLL